MESVFRYVSPPDRCGYLPDRQWQMEYDIVGEMSAAEYMERLAQGWRRFGATLFRPKCVGCHACQSLRVLVDRFRPNRSARRVRKTNESLIHLQVGKPSVTRAKLDLYDRYHAYQAEAKGWPIHEVKDAASYAHAFVDNPFPTQEWCYFMERQLVGVGYVDDLPGGFSAIYFFYDPEIRQYSLGTWNILCQLEQAALRGLPHLYLGYYVAGCRSMQYKARFVPCQVLGIDGQWHDFRQ